MMGPRTFLDRLAESMHFDPLGASFWVPAAITGGTQLGGAIIGSHGANAAADKSAAGAKYAADLEAKSTKEALDFARQQATSQAANDEINRKANYGLFAAREGRLGTVGQMLGLGPRQIPAYVPGQTPNFMAPNFMSGMVRGYQPGDNPMDPATRARVMGTVGSYV